MYQNQVFPPSLKNQTLSQIFAFSKTSDKFNPFFWLQVERAAVRDHKFKTARNAQKNRIQLMRSH